MLQFETWVSVLFWSALYIAYLHLQSWIIVGVKLSSAGTTEIMPDGSEKDSEMILYPLYKHLHQVRRQEYMYMGDQLDKLIKQLEVTGLFPYTDICIDWGFILFKNREDKTQFLNASELILRQFGVIVTERGERVTLSKVYNEFIYDKWLRQPIIGCVKCMSSFWSLFTFLIPMFAIFGIHRWILTLWIPTILALVFLNAKNYKEVK